MDQWKDRVQVVSPDEAKGWSLREIPPMMNETWLPIIEAFERNYGDWKNIERTKELFPVSIPGDQEIVMSSDDYQRYREAKWVRAALPIKQRIEYENVRVRADTKSLPDSLKAFFPDLNKLTADWYGFIPEREGLDPDHMRPLSLVIEERIAESQRLSGNWTKRSLVLDYRKIDIEQVLNGVTFIEEDYAQGDKAIRTIHVSGTETSDNKEITRKTGINRRIYILRTPEEEGGLALTADPAKRRSDLETPWNRSIDMPSFETIIQETRIETGGDMIPVVRQIAQKQEFLDFGAAKWILDEKKCDIHPPKPGEKDFSEADEALHRRIAASIPIDSEISTEIRYLQDRINSSPKTDITPEYTRGILNYGIDKLIKILANYGVSINESRYFVESRSPYRMPPDQELTVESVLHLFKKARENRILRLERSQDARWLEQSARDGTIRTDQVEIEHLDSLERQWQKGTKDGKENVRKYFEKIRRNSVNAVMAGLEALRSQPAINKYGMDEIYTGDSQDYWLLNEAMKYQLAKQALEKDFAGK